jgi:hypothetical protein
MAWTSGEAGDKEGVRDCDPFGLVYVDFVTQKRMSKLSAAFFPEAATRNAVVQPLSPGSAPNISGDRLAKRVRLFETLVRRLRPQELVIAIDGGGARVLMHGMILPLPGARFGTS